VLPLAPSFDTVGVLARDPAHLSDAHAALAASDDTTGADTSGTGELPTEVLLAADTLEWIDGDAANALARAAELVASRLGARHEMIDLRGFTSVEVARTFARIQGRELWAAHGEWVEPNLDCFIDEVRVRLERARGVSTAPSTEQESADFDAWTRYRRAFAAVVGPGTLVVLPVLHDFPPLRTATDDDLVAFRSACFRLTAPSSLTGGPELVVPVHHRRSGNTYGIGLLGAPGADRSLLEVATIVGRDGALDV
jgi:amidase